MLRIWARSKCICFFFFKQKTAYEIGTGDWSSDVCSSDLLPLPEHKDPDWSAVVPSPWNRLNIDDPDGEGDEDRKSVV